MNAHLVISSSTELIRIPAKQILYIASDGNYSMLHLVGGEARGRARDLQGNLIEIGAMPQKAYKNVNFVYWQ